MEHHAHRLAVRYPNQRLAGQNFLHRHQAAGSGCAGQSLRSGPQAQCVHGNVRWGHKRSLQDGRSCRWHLGGHLPHESLAQVRRQSHRDREPLSGFGDTITDGRITCSRRTRAQAFPHTSFYSEELRRTAPAATPRASSSGKRSPLGQYHGCCVRRSFHHDRLADHARFGYHGNPGRFVESVADDTAVQMADSHTRCSLSSLVVAFLHNAQSPDAEVL